MDSGLPQLALTHGQAVWVLGHMGFRTGDSVSAFNSYIKYLRRAGLPFARDELGVGTGHNVVYGYDHLMELAVALALRAQAILPNDIVQLLANLRSKLRPIYRQAYIERNSGLGAPCLVKLPRRRPFNVAGVYLDLGLMYVETGFLLHGHPKAIGPADAVELFGTAHLAQQKRGLINLSELAEDVVKLASGAPEIRRGRQ
jgi:hypothetical protein